MQFTSNFQEWAVEGSITAILLAHIRLWFAHFKLREEVATKYVPKNDTTISDLATGLKELRTKMETDNAKMQETITHILEYVAEIRGRLNARPNSNGT